MKDFARDSRRWTRTLHLYLSMVGLVFMLFFAVTGFLLNHSDWFAPEEPHTRTVTGAIPASLVAGPDRLGVVEKLRADFGATGALESFLEEEDRLELVFKSPGRQTEAIIRRRDGQAEVRHESRGLIGRLNDLHKAAHSGSVWPWMVDGIALLMVISSVTGLVLGVTATRQRRVGLAAVTLSLLLCVLIYIICIP